MAAPQRSTFIKARCDQCGYDMRGTNSVICPECGALITTSVEFASPVEFHRARNLLARAGLPFRAVEAGGMLGPVGLVHGFGSPTGRIFVPVSHIDEVRHVLDEAGIGASLGVLPIVDRAEPNCPACHAELPPDGPEQCGRCGAEFEWVSIEEPEPDPTGVRCRKCGYELTGNTTGRCPECNWPVPQDLDELVETATRSGLMQDQNHDPGADGDDQASADRYKHRAHQIMMVVLLVIGLAFLGMIGRSVVMNPTNFGYGLLIFCGGAFVLLMVWLEWRGGRRG